MSVIESWDSAVSKIADTFCEAAQMRQGQNGNFFLDHFPPVYDAAALYVSGGPDAVPWLGDAPPTEINMDWRLEGRFRKREDARAFAALCMAALPIKRSGNVQVCQPTAAPILEGKYFKLRDTDEPQLLFSAELAGRVVFAVGRAYG
jgi:hypothetical protein